MPGGGGPPTEPPRARGRRPAREIATRERRSEWSISKPGQALPPPPGTTATFTPTGLAPRTAATFTPQAQWGVLHH